MDLVQYMGNAMVERMSDLCLLTPYQFLYWITGLQDLVYDLQKPDN